ISSCAAWGTECIDPRMSLSTADHGPLRHLSSGQTFDLRGGVQEADGLPIVRNAPSCVRRQKQPRRPAFMARIVALALTATDRPRPLEFPLGAGRAPPCP